MSEIFAGVVLGNCVGVERPVYRPVSKNKTWSVCVALMLFDAHSVVNVAVLFVGAVFGYCASVWSIPSTSPLQKTKTWKVCGAQILSDTQSVLHVAVFFVGVVIGYCVCIEHPIFRPVSKNNIGKCVLMILFNSQSVLRVGVELGHCVCVEHPIYSAVKKNLGSVCCHDVF